VQRDNFSSVFGSTDKTNGIGIRAVFLGAPVENIEPIKILRVNNSEFALAQGNSAIGVAEFATTILDYGPGADFVEPNGDLNIDICERCHNKSPFRKKSFP
jgi:hypothetical protein